MILAVTFGDDNFSQSRDYNLKSALIYGKVDKVKKYSRADLDSEFCEKNKDILAAKRGGGYWIWKPYIINDAFKNLSDGDYLVYADSGSFYKKDIHLLTDYMSANGIEVFLNELEHEEGKYSKRDAFVYMGMDDKGIAKTKQYEASFLLVKKNSNTKRFLKEWLEFSCDKRIISDDENTCKLANYEGFIENRHDQTVLSILAKKYQYQGNRPIDKPREKGKENYDYPQIIVRTRFRNCNLLKFKIKILFKHLEYAWLNSVGVTK